jgi:TIR domain
VLRWAQDLAGHGIRVLIDRWSLKEGQDKYAFMESMVTDQEVNHVLCFSDATYAEKADKREGGVGTESQIITPQLYAKANQTKFIPIVCEFDATGEPCLPAFFSGRIYVDFSSPERANSEWERLVRLIYDKPAIVEPTLGQVPAFIKNPQSLPNMTARKLISYREAFEKGGSMTEFYRNDYLDSVVTDLERFAISRPMGIQGPGTEPFWETLVHQV